MRLSNILLSLAASIASVLAAVEITVPSAGASVPNTGFTITWVESGSTPSVTDLTGYNLYLYTGPNTAPVIVGPVLASDTTSPTPASITVTIPAGLGGSTTNAYFLGMVSKVAGGTVTNYSNRFTITGMTGTSSVALGTISSTDGPEDVNNIAAAAGVEARDVYGTPYNLQTGPTRYAAMQPVPPTKITATNTAPLYPTSSVQLASAPLPAQDSIVTTVTQANTFQVSSHANTASPASQPVDDMQRFLNRWKD